MKWTQNNEFFLIAALRSFRGRCRPEIVRFWRNKSWIGWYERVICIKYGYVLLHSFSNGWKYTYRIAPLFIQRKWSGDSRISKDQRLIEQVTLRPLWTRRCIFLAVLARAIIITICISTISVRYSEKSLNKAYPRSNYVVFAMKLKSSLFIAPIFACKSSKLFLVIT